MIPLSILLAGTATVLLLPSASDLLSVLRLPFARRRGGRRGDPAPPTRLLLLVPAHDEELLLGGCLRSLAQLTYPASLLRVVVIADNCSDGTADVARAAGVEVLERADATRRGKPYAIVWALERLRAGNHDAVVIVDADSVLDPGFASGLAGAAPLADKAVQSYNDVSNRTENSLTRMAAVFSAARFRFINALKMRVGLNAPLGNGLCIGARVLETHGWNAFSICEDWELYADLTARGVRVESVPAAHIFSQEARSVQQAATQRQRWTAGRLQVLARYIPRMLRGPVSAFQKLDALAELSAPGPAVHLGVAAVGTAIALLLRPPFWPWLAGALGLSVVRLVIYTIAAVGVSPQPMRTALAFSFLPFYALWRIGNQLLSLANVGDQRWVRTRRHVDS